MNREFQGISEWWTVYPHNNDYLVSDKGTVFDLRTGKSVSQSYVYGYKHISLRDKDGRGYVCKRSHRVIIESFREKPEWATEINHINFIKDDNRLYNLEWSTPKLNTAHSIKYGKHFTFKRGEESYPVKLSEKDVLEINNMLKSKVSQYQIAKRFGVARSTIGNIAQGNNWSWLTGIPCKRYLSKLTNKEK